MNNFTHGNKATSIGNQLISTYSKFLVEYEQANQQDLDSDNCKICHQVRSTSSLRALLLCLFSPPAPHPSSRSSPCSPPLINFPASPPVLLSELFLLLIPLLLFSSCSSPNSSCSSSFLLSLPSSYSFLIPAPPAPNSPYSLLSLCSSCPFLLPVLLLLFPLFLLLFLLLFPLLLLRLPLLFCLCGRFSVHFSFS